MIFPHLSIYPNPVKTVTPLHLPAQGWNRLSMPFCNGLLFPLIADCR